MADDFTDFARRETGISHKIEVLVIDTTSLFNDNPGEGDGCRVFPIVDLAFQSIDYLVFLQPSEFTQSGMR